MRSKNFDFLKYIDHDKYEDLCRIEYNAYLYPKTAAHQCRLLTEKIVYDLLKKNKLQYSGDLGYDLIRLNDRKLKHPRPKNLKSVHAECYTLYGQEERTLNAYDFLRNLGNAGSHDNSYPIHVNQANPVPNTENIMYALSTFHVLIRNIYKCEDTLAFRREDVPIGDYFIEYARTSVVDRDRTNCIGEYYVYKYTSDDDNYDDKIFGLIREFEIDNNTNIHFFNRMINVYSVMRKALQNGDAKVIKLNAPRTENANYYIVYEYDENLVPLRSLLDKQILKSNDRVALCLEIAKKLAAFHESDRHIYLRLLTYDSVMIRIADSRSFTDHYEPVIVKYELAKIADNNDQGITLLEVVQSVKERDYTDSTLTRYCIDDSFNENTDWERVDVGSLGVLFIDICKGMITTENPQELLEKFVSEEMIPLGMVDLMRRMISDEINNRPSIKEVITEMSVITT